MATKREFFRMAEAADCGVEYLRGNGAVWLTLWAPEGQAFKGSGCACDSSFNQMTNAAGSAIDWPAACRALASILADGFDPCEEGAA